MISKISLRKITIQMADGAYLTLTPVNILDRTHLFKVLDEIQDILSSLTEEERINLTFEDLFDEDEYFRHLCCEAVRLGGLNPERLTLDVIYCLLMPYYDEENDIFHKQGALVELNFSQRISQLAGNEGEQQTKETMAELLGGLWASTSSVTEAMSLITDIPADELIEVLQYRAKIVEEANKTPEQKKVEESKAERAKFKEKFRQKREKAKRDAEARRKKLQATSNSNQ